MMYYEEIVAVLCDNKKNPLRELDSKGTDSGRKTKVFLPFNSEYQILIKNNSHKRIKLNIDIDGTNVSGNGLIFKAHEVGYVERFIDIAKKFKFVKSTNEGISDPTNLENGVIKIRVNKEKEIEYTWPINRTYNDHIFQDHMYRRTYIGTPPIVQPNQPMWFSETTSNMVGSSQPVNYSCSVDAPKIKSLVDQNQILRSLNNDKLESGATIEGSESKQTFDTTYWNGDDGKEIVFTFNLFGNDSNERQEKLDQYLKLKAELGI